MGDKGCFFLRFRTDLRDPPDLVLLMSWKLLLCPILFSLLPFHSFVPQINNSLISLLHADLHIRPSFPGELNKKVWYPDWSEIDVLQLDHLLLRRKGDPSLVVGGLQVAPGMS